MIRQSSDRTRRRLSGSFERLHSSVQRLAEARQRPFWDSVSRLVVARVKRSAVGVSVEDVFRPADHLQAFNAAMLPVWNAAAWHGVKFEADWLEAHGITREQAARFSMRQTVDIEGPAPPPSIHVEPSDSLKRAVSEFLKGRTAGVWSRVGKTTHDRLARTLAAALREGDALDAMVARVRKVMDDVSRHGARRIARTETTSSMNHGQQAERDDLGIEQKEWISTKDIRVRGADSGDRFNHLIADGQIVGNAGVFLVSGERLRFPGDTSLGASGGNVIHCRCAAVGAFDTKPASAKLQPGKAPSHITFTGQPTEMSRKVWKAIGEGGLADEKHAREVGRILRREVEESSGRLAKKLRIDDRRREFEETRDAWIAENKRIGKLLADGAMPPADELERLDDLLGKRIKAADALRKAEADLSQHRADAALKLLREVRDFGGEGHTYKTARGAGKLKATFQKAEEHVPTDWLKASRAKGELTIKKRARGYFSGWEGEIAIGGPSHSATALHELMHAAEFAHERLGQMQAQFKATRRMGETLTEIYPKSREMGFKDGFTEHYMGKVYQDRSGNELAKHHEILSMGWEGIAHGKYNLWSGDPQMVEFILGVLAGV